MYKAVNKLKSTEPRKNILVQGPNGKVTNNRQQAEIISQHFHHIFFSENQEDFEVKPAKMNPPFQRQEIEKAIKSLKDGKSPGIDNLQSELIKHGPTEITDGIVNILNKIAETGIYPKELNEGILIPLPKPGKKQGPPENLRPIILLTVLRKILAICIIRRTTEKINQKIPISQAAYKSGRSTTEHVFTFKCLAEKALVSKDYHTHLLLLDMSKAFDTVQRKIVIEDLKEILDDGELHIIATMIKEVKLQVRVKDETTNNFPTNIGVPQGDCMSPILFTLYLAQALKHNRTEIEQEHSYAKPQEIKREKENQKDDHTYATFKDIYTTIDQQYADDIGWASNSKHIIDNIELQAADRVHQRNLNVNQGKTEKYTIERNGDNSWKACKYLGSKLDTEEDFKRRKSLAISAKIKLQHLFNSKANTEIKIRALNALVGSIFLYNSELWTVTRNLEHKIDVFHRNLLRNILKIHFPKKISNEELYRKTKSIPWSKTIRKRRLSWLGHLLRLPEEAPAQKALTEFLRPVKRPPGRPITTWVGNAIKELK